MSRLIAKLSLIIQGDAQNANTKHDINQNNDWDDDFDVASKKIKTPQSLKKQNKTINPMFIMLITIIIFLIILFFYQNDNRKILSIASQKNDTQLIDDQQKLDSPLIGNDDNSNKLKSTDELSNIDFDFSVIISNDIARTPLLPNKVHSAKDKTNTSEFQDIWNNGTNSSNTTQETTNKNESKKTASDYLPPWRRFAEEYQPTENMPIFSIILEYNPELLNVDNLPTQSGYDIVIPGFLEESKELLQKLRKKNYEVLLYLPMDDNSSALNFKPITQNSSFDDIREAVTFHTAQLGGEGFVGFMNYGGKILQNNLSKINFMMSLLSKTGYLYIDNIHDNEKSLGFASAEGQKVPTLKTKTYIQSVTQEFPRFIKQVKMDGTGIAVIKATPENIAALEEYEPILNNSQVHRIPVTGILKQQMLQNIENNLY